MTTPQEFAKILNTPLELDLCYSDIHTNLMGFDEYEQMSTDRKLSTICSIVDNIKEMGIDNFSDNFIDFVDTDDTDYDYDEEGYEE